MSYIFSLDNRSWDYSLLICWIGGYFPVPNLSQGYHGILKQWWEAYMKGTKVLLISESKAVKDVFIQQYPHWTFETLDLFPEESHATQQDCDIFGDIAHHHNPLRLNHYDLIINQATLEHVYNPFGAMKNMIEALCPGGILVSHTHPPEMAYHQVPRDYFRFMIDWWIDLPQYIPNHELIELFQFQNRHVFSCYRKLNQTDSKIK